MFRHCILCFQKPINVSGITLPKATSNGLWLGHDRAEGIPGEIGKKQILRLPKEDFSLIWFAYSYRRCPQEMKLKTCQNLRCLVTDLRCSHDGERQDLHFFSDLNPLFWPLCIHFVSLVPGYLQRVEVSGV